MLFVCLVCWIVVCWWLGSVLTWLCGMLVSWLNFVIGLVVCCCMRVGLVVGVVYFEILIGIKKFCIKWGFLCFIEWMVQVDFFFGVVFLVVVGLVIVGLLLVIVGMVL